MREKILELRNQGQTYDQISTALGCSKSTVSYHCSLNGKKKVRDRVKKHRENSHPLIRKIESFKARRALKTKTEHFQCRASSEHPLRDLGKTRISMRHVNLTFKADDVIKKFGNNPKCNLTGREINWEDSSTYALDHIIPVASGGSNSLENLNLVCPEVNRAKSDLSMEDFLSLCKEVLEYNGYQVMAA